MHVLYDGLCYENEHFSTNYKSEWTNYLSFKVRHNAYAYS